MSVALALVISVVFATCGYMTFTGYTEGKLLDPSILVLAIIRTFLPFCLIFFCKHLGDYKKAKIRVYLGRYGTIPRSYPTTKTGSKDVSYVLIAVRFLRVSLTSGSPL